jgi:hypothetical protein
MHERMIASVPYLFTISHLPFYRVEDEKVRCPLRAFATQLFIATIFHFNIKDRVSRIH